MCWVGEGVGAGDGSCAQSGGFPVGKPRVTATGVVGGWEARRRGPRSRPRWVLGGSLPLRETPPGSACEEQK